MKARASPGYARPTTERSESQVARYLLGGSALSPIPCASPSGVSPKLCSTPRFARHMRRETGRNGLETHTATAQGFTGDRSRKTFPGTISDRRARVSRSL